MAVFVNEKVKIWETLIKYKKIVRVLTATKKSLSLIGPKLRELDGCLQFWINMTSRVQCVSLDSTSLIIYPEIKATEVPFQSWKSYLCSF